MSSLNDYLESPTAPVSLAALSGTAETAPPPQTFGLYRIVCQLSGKSAFSGHNALDRYVAIVNEDPPRLKEQESSVPDALDELVHRALSKEPTSARRAWKRCWWRCDRSGIADPMEGHGSPRDFGKKLSQPSW